MSTWTVISMYNEAVTNHPRWEKHLWCYWKQSEYDSHTDLPSAAGWIKFKSRISSVQTIIIYHGFHWSILTNYPRWLHITTIQHVYSLLVNYFVGLRAWNKHWGLGPLSWKRRAMPSLHQRLIYKTFFHTYQKKKCMSKHENGGVADLGSSLTPWRQNGTL